MLIKSAFAHVIKNPSKIYKLNGIVMDYKDKKIYDIMERIYGENKVLPMALLVENGIEAVYLNELYDLTVSAEEFESILSTLTDNSQNIKIQNIVSGLKQGTIAYREAKREMISILNQATKKEKDDMRPIQDIMIDYLKSGTEDGIATGFKLIDESNNGFMRGEFVVVGARPGVGKTTFLLNLIANLYPNNSISFFSAEMRANQIMVNLLSRLTGIDNLRIRAKMVNKQEELRIASIMDAIKGEQIYIDDTCAININDLYIKAEYCRNNNYTDIIMVDYIQLLSYLDSKMATHEKIEYICKVLKQIARNFNVVVIALAQISRETDRKDDEYIPRLADLKDSAGIEQNADMVIFMTKMGKDRLVIGTDWKDNPKTDLIRMTIAKNRNGITGYFYLKYEKNYCKMSEIPSNIIVEKSYER